MRDLEERFASDQLHFPMHRGELDAHLAIGVEDDGAAILQDEFFRRLVELRAVDLARAGRGARPQARAECHQRRAHVARRAARLAHRRGPL